MLTSMLDASVVAILLLGVGAPVLGFVGLLGCFGRRLRVIVLASSALSLGALAAVAGTLGQPLYLWLPSVILAAVCCLGILAGSNHLDRALNGLMGLVRWRVLPWAVLLAAGPVLAFVWIWHLDAASTPAEPEFASDPAFAVVELERSAPSLAYSDAGRPVPLYRSAQHLSQVELSATDGSLFEAWGLSGHVIRTGTASDEYNCHGWVFAEGHCWVKGEDVPTILEDNGYHPVSQPHVGDIVVFRDYGGHVAHSGVVRIANPDTPILIESKLGKGGRFIHTPEALRYGVDYAYYHTARPDHSIFSHHGSSDPAVEQHGITEQSSTED
jgi:hypothetical protein